LVMKYSSLTRGNTQKIIRQSEMGHLPVSGGCPRKQPGKEWFNTAAFVEPAPYTFGNSGRDVLLGPSYKDLDLSLSKSFPIRKLGEGGRFEIRCDATDFLNNPNFGEPDTNIGTIGAGVISTANTNRLIQLGALLTF
jgi:hypothetical protein